MFRKVSMTAAAALAIAGAFALTPSQAKAASSFTIGGDWGYVQIRDGYPYANLGYYGYGGYPYGKYGYNDYGRYPYGNYGYYGYGGYPYGKYGSYGHKRRDGGGYGHGDHRSHNGKWKGKNRRRWNAHNNRWHD